MEYQYERHPLSEIWPDYSEEAFTDLVEDIRVNGIIAPIVLYEGKVIDGWHRYRAALQVSGVTIPTLVYEDDSILQNMDPRDYVISINAQRRMLTVSQRAMAIAMIRDPRGPGNPDMVGAPGMTMQEIADEANASAKTMYGAFKVRDAGMENMVLEGKATINEVLNIISEEKALETENESLDTRTPTQDVDAPIDDPNKPIHDVSPPLKPTGLTKAALQEQLLDLEDELEDKNDVIQDLKHRLEFLENESSPVEAVREQKFNSLLADNKTLEAATQTWQAKYADLLKENKQLAKNNQHLASENAKLIEQLNVRKN